MATLRFNTNVPLELHLRFLEGKEVESQFGGMQHMFSAEEGAFYVSDTVGAVLSEQLKRHNVQAGEPVEICKREVSNGNGRKSIRWTVERVGVPTGEQKDGTFAVPKETPSDLEQKLAESIRMAQEKKAQAPSPAWAVALTEQTNALLDSFASVLKHSARYEGLRPEDVRSIFLSAYINLSKGGTNRAA